MYGSRGDVQPFLALATALDRAGHDVQLAGPAHFESFVTGYGIRFTRLDTGMLRNFDSRQMRDAVGRNLRGLAALKALRLSAVQASQAIRPVLDAAWAAADGADLVVHHPLGFAGHHIAEKLGVPAVVGQPYPMFVPTREFPSAAFHYRALRYLPGPLRRATYPLFGRMLRAFAGKEIDNWRERSLGLPPRPDRHNVLRRPDGGPAPVLNAVSRHVLPPPRDYPDSVHTTGFWSLPAPADWTPPRELTDFLAAGEAPIYLGFGSLVGDPASTGRVAVDAIRAAGVRAVLATGRGGLDVPDCGASDVFVLGEAPHDWLLPRMAAVVHHGGGGTVATTTTLGRPQVICPFVLDQVFWGDRLHRLGVAPPHIMQRKLSVERLAGAIRRAVGDAGMARRARDIGERVRAEDGAAEAVGVLARIHAGKEMA